MRLRFLFLLCLFLCGSGHVFSQERYLKPVDEGKNDASFYAFRTKLIAAVEKRDAKYILGILDRNIRLSFGGHSGVADFKELWKIDKASSKFWDEFLPVIRNGGSFFRDGSKITKIFYAPYSFEGFPDDVDAFTHQVIFGNNVNLRERPSANSIVVTTLSHNIVKADYENSVKLRDADDGYDWLKIETLGGIKGYVKAEYVRSPIDYRAGFEKKGGIWKMTAFIAGD